MNPAVTTGYEFLSNWTFWSFVVSATVAFFTFGPKLYSWIVNYKSSPEISLGKTLGFSHVLGLANCQMYISVSNNSNRNIRVKKITLELNGYFGTNSIEAKNYQKDNTVNFLSPFTPFLLKPSQDWGYIAFFLADMNASTETKFRKLINNVQSLLNKNSVRNIQSAASNSISDSMATSNYGAFPPPPFIVPPDVLNNMLDLYSELNIWKTGNYTVKVRMETNRGTIFSDEYNVLLLDNDIQTLEAQTETYINGVYLHPNPWIFAPVRIKDN